MGAVGAPLVLRVGWWLGVPAAVAAGLVGWFAVQGARRPGAIGAVLASVLLYAAVLGWELPRLWPLWIAPRVVAALEPIGERGARIGAVGFAEPSLMVLGGTALHWFRAEEAVDAWVAGRVDTLVVGDRELEAVMRLAAVRGLVPRVVAVVPGYNYSRGRPVMLSILRPAD